jgi:hypothetical protein
MFGARFPQVPLSPKRVISLKTVFILFSLLLLLPATGCGQREKRSEELPTLIFNTTDSLVADRTADSLMQISFRPPKGWVRLPKKSIDSAMKGVNPTVTDPLDHTPNLRSVFFDKSSGSYFVSTKLDSLSFADTAFIVQRAIAYYKRADSTSVVRSALFSWGPFHIQQLMVIASETVTIKMFFFSTYGHSQPFEWDFQIPESLYPDKARTIESVVGSLQIHNTIH